jgi:7-keto-8-aminopelargonate synthetase-like enzyme
MRLTQRQMARGVVAGLTRLRTEDEELEDPFITVNGMRLVDFGSCSYLGLNRDPRLVEGAQAAVKRFGTSHSSSTMYTSIGLYNDLEDRLRKIFGGEVAVAPTTTLAHIAAIPVLVGPEDLAILDKQAHASLHLAATILVGNGVTVQTVEHNDMAELHDAIEQAAARYDKVWYITDGLYSMHGDLAPITELRPMLDEFPNLYLYLDDAHAFGWKGFHGAGHTLSEMSLHERLVVAVGFAKSFGTTGAALAFGDPDLAERVVLCGAPFTFSGPLQPATLGASIASADIHLSPEHAERQAELIRKINLTRRLLLEYGLPVADLSTTPIWFIRVGSVDDVLDTMRKLMGDGFYVNPSAYPAVPLGDGGIRFTLTLHQSDEVIESLIAAMARHIPAEPKVTIDLSEYEDAGIDAIDAHN